jgi:hypothetical protein
MRDLRRVWAGSCAVAVSLACVFAPGQAGAIEAANSGTLVEL